MWFNLIGYCSSVRRLLAAQNGVARVNEILTLHQGPEDVLLTMSLDFKDGMDSSRVEEIISELESRIKKSFPAVTRVFIEAQSWKSHQHQMRRG